jgi:peptidyl-prolyl cis-trans isomerase D
MIRFMQTSATFKKYVLTSILVVICIAMAWYLVPTFTGQGLGNNSNNPVLASVAGSEITTAAVRKEAIRIIEQQYPSARAQASILMPMVAKQASELLINQRILIAEARRMGFKATPDDIRQELQHGELGATFFPGGKFVGMEAYENLLANHDLTRDEFEQSIADNILIRKLQAAVNGGVAVTDADVRKEFEKRNTKVQFDYAVIKKDDILKTLHPTEPELQAFYERNKQNYVNSIPEKRQLKYVVLDNARMLAQTIVTQQQLEDYYSQHRDEFRIPEQVTVRQIVINKPLPGSDGKIDQKALDAARAKADDVAKQLKAGANFADLAKKYSDDATKEQGGLVGSVRPDVFPDAAVKTAVTSTPRGQTSDVISAGYAFVIIHVDDRQEARVKPLAEVKDQIEPLIKQQNAAQEGQRAAEQLLSQARASGSSLEKAAASKGLQVTSTDFVTSRDALPGIGADPQFMNMAFAKEKNEPPDLASVHAGFVIYQVTDVKPPATPTFAEIRDRLENEFKNERAAQLLNQKTQELADQAKAKNDLRKAAKEAGAQVKTSEFVAPDGQVPDIGSMSGQAAVAFTLKPGEISGPINSGSAGAVLSLLERQAPTDQDFAAKKDQIREGLIQEKQAEMFGLFLSNLRDQMQKAGKLIVNQAQLETLTKPRSED